MSTAADLITQALKDIQVLDESETPSAYLMADALATLNQMLASWQVSNLYVYAQTETTFSPTGAISYTVGSGGNVNITRPDRIDYAFLRDSGGLDYPIDLLETFEEYQGIGLKTLSTIPSVFYYNPSYPLGTLYLYPQPSAADGIMHIIASTPLPVYGAAATAINMPPEYDIAIRFSLAEILGEMMGKGASNGIVAFAAKARRMLKRNNLKISPLNINEGGRESGLLRIKRGY